MTTLQQYAPRLGFSCQENRCPVRILLSSSHALNPIRSHRQIPLIGIKRDNLHQQDTIFHSLNLFNPFPTWRKKLALSIDLFIEPNIVALLNPFQQARHHQPKHKES